MLRVPWIGYALQLETSSVWPRIIIIVRTGSASVSNYVIKPTTALAQIANCINLPWIHILNMALTENWCFPLCATQYASHFPWRLCYRMMLSSLLLSQCHTLMHSYYIIRIVEEWMCTFKVCRQIKLTALTNPNIHFRLSRSDY